MRSSRYLMLASAMSIVAFAQPPTSSTLKVGDRAPDFHIAFHGGRPRPFGRLHRQEHGGGGVLSRRVHRRLNS